MLKTITQKLTAFDAENRLRYLTRQAFKLRLPRDIAPVLFFNASSRLGEISQNAAFTLLSALGLQTAGVPVVYFACERGLSQCVLGTRWDAPEQKPPCNTCTRRSRSLFAHAPVLPLHYEEDAALAARLAPLGLRDLMGFRLPLPGFRESLPLGSLATPSLRWSLRMHTLPDDATSRSLMQRYMLSAANLAQRFDVVLQQVQPQAVWLFNGMMFPEATARWVAQQRGVRTITQEVGFQPFSTFVTDGEATAYPLALPDDFTLTAEQNARLDAYLEQRFQGKFTMAGIRFWKEMLPLDDLLLTKMAAFDAMVPVFTNVIYDTSQVHANRIFNDMFHWLETIVELITAHPRTLFVVRAHPDEVRPNSRKQSRETVQNFLAQRGLLGRENVVFIDSQTFVSSYALIGRSKFVMVYNSSIGLEATLLGAPVLCGGKARFTQIPTVFLPNSPAEYRRMADEFLQVQGIQTPPEFIENARKFLYAQLYRASLPYDAFLEAADRPGMVRLKPFDLQALAPENCAATRALVDGLLQGKPFWVEA
ncbi:MAG: hypothetical protein OHK0052_09960 [Anaerolineales bacterium]